MERNRGKSGVSWSCDWYAATSGLLLDCRAGVFGLRLPKSGDDCTRTDWRAHVYRDRRAVGVCKDPDHSTFPDVSAIVWATAIRTAVTKPSARE